MVQGERGTASGSLASVSRRGSRVPTEAAGLAGASRDARCASGGRFEPRATCPRGVPPRRTEPRTAGGAALSGNSPQALDRCRERSLLERVSGGFRTSATARFTLAGVDRAPFFAKFQSFEVSGFPCSRSHFRNFETLKPCYLIVSTRPCQLPAFPPLISDIHHCLFPRFAYISV